MTYENGGGLRFYLLLVFFLSLHVPILVLLIVGITADPAENYDTLTHLFFKNIYERNAKGMSVLIDSLSSDELINLLSMEYAPEGTDKQLTPLMLATVLGDAEMVKLLLEKGADPHRMCLRKINSHHILINGSPLWVAASLGHLDVCRALVAHGANVELGLENGITPLMTACDAGHKDIAIFLMKHGASVGRIDNIGNTALMGASIMGRMNIVRFLLSKGARIEPKNKNGKTATDLASEYGHSEIVYYLQTEQRKKAAATGHNDL